MRSGDVSAMRFAQRFKRFLTCVSVGETKVRARGNRTKMLTERSMPALEAINPIPSSPLYAYNKNN